MAKSLQATVARWTNSAGQAEQSYKEGVAGTQVDVMQRAISAAGSAVRNYSESITSGRWASAINQSGGTANWKAMAQAKAGNYSTGIQAGAPKFQNAMQKLLPAIEQIVSTLPPRQAGNMAASKARVGAFIDAMHARKGEFKG